MRARSWSGRLLAACSDVFNLRTALPTAPPLAQGCSGRLGALGWPCWPLGLHARLGSLQPCRHTGLQLHLHRDPDLFPPLQAPGASAAVSHPCMGPLQAGCGAPFSRNWHLSVCMMKWAGAGPRAVLPGTGLPRSRACVESRQLKACSLLWCLAREAEGTCPVPRV